MDQKTIDKYNPDKFRELTKDDIEAMRQFTKDDVADLAKAYPNKPTQRAYLVLFDNTDGAKQLYPLATWQNLLAIWNQQLTKYIAYNFASLHNNKSAANIQGLKTGPVQDLTQAEVTRAIKTVPGKKAEVKSIPLGQSQTPKKVEKDFTEDDDYDSDSDWSGSDSDYASDSDFEQLENEAKITVKKNAPKKSAPKKAAKELSAKAKKAIDKIKKEK